MYSPPALHTTQLWTDIHSRPLINPFWLWTSIANTIWNPSWHDIQWQTSWISIEPGPLDHFQNLFHGTQLLKALLLTLLGWGGAYSKTRTFCWDRLGPESLCCNACTWIKVSSRNKGWLASYQFLLIGKGQEFRLALISPSYITPPVFKSSESLLLTTASFSC